ncbi:MAG: transposase [Planctomycetota bacterium]
MQLITSAIAQTAVEADANAVEDVLQDLKANDLAPDEMLVDTGYAGDENVQLAAEQGVELVGPVPGFSTEDDEQLNIDDFNVDEETEEIICCPAGYEPESSEHNSDTDKTKTLMPESTCGQCEFRKQCPVEKIAGQYKLEHTAKQRRLASRRREQDTEVFRERYKIRGGIEGTNSGLKRKTGLGRLRVRGRPAVFHAIYFRIAGWNIMRASVCAKMREIVYARANRAVFWLNFVFLRMKIVAKSVCVAVSERFLLHCLELEKSSKLSIAT